MRLKDQNVLGSAIVCASSKEGKKMLIECITHFSIYYHRYQRLSHTQSSTLVGFFSTSQHSLTHSLATCSFARALILHFIFFLPRQFRWWNAVKISLQMYIFTRQPLMSFNYIFWKDKMKESDFIPLRSAIWLLGSIMAMCKMYLKEKQRERRSKKTDLDGCSGKVFGAVVSSSPIHRCCFCARLFIHSFG